MNSIWESASIDSAEYQDSGASPDLRDAGDAFTEHREAVTRESRPIRVSGFEEVHSAFVWELAIVTEGNNSNNLLRAEPMRDLFAGTLSVVLVNR